MVSIVPGTRVASGLVFTSIINSIRVRITFDSGARFFVRIPIMACTAVLVLGNLLKRFDIRPLTFRLTSLWLELRRAWETSLVIRDASSELTVFNIVSTSLQCSTLLSLCRAKAGNPRLGNLAGTLLTWGKLVRLNISIDRSAVAIRVISGVGSIWPNCPGKKNITVRASNFRFSVILPGRSRNWGRLRRALTILLSVRRFSSGGNRSSITTILTLDTKLETIAQGSRATHRFRCTRLKTIRNILLTTIIAKVTVSLALGQCDSREVTIAATIMATGLAGLETRAGAFLYSVVKKLAKTVLHSLVAVLVLEVILKVRVKGNVITVVAILLNRLLC